MWPTTIAVRANGESFGVADVALSEDLERKEAVGRSAHSAACTMRLASGVEYQVIT